MSSGSAGGGAGSLPAAGTIFNLGQGIEHRNLRLTRRISPGGGCVWDGPGPQDQHADAHDDGRRR